MLITISGLPGSGTSTVAKRVAAELGFAHLDGGTVFRQLAADRGMTLAAFGAYAEEHPEIDVELDGRLAARARTGDVVLESRLAGWIAVNEQLSGLRVWIACDEIVRAARVARRDLLDVESALAANRAREASERARYARYYGIDITDLGIYDLVLDSTSAAPEDLAAAVIARARAVSGE
ncbi:MAG: (d)CMP kinase [Acidimicrobiales bacterium]